MTLEEYRKRDCIKRTEMSRDLKIPYRTLVMYESKTNLPKVTTAIKIAKYLGVRVRDIEWC